MKTATLNKIKEEHIDSIMLLKASSFNEEAIHQYFEEQEVNKEDIEILIKLSEKVEEMAADYADIMSEYFDSERTDEEFIQLLLDEGFEEDVANAMNTYLTFQKATNEVKPMVEEALMQGTDPETLIKTMVNEDLDEDIATVIIYGSMNKINPDQLAKSYHKVKGIRKIRMGALWLGIGTLATVIVEGTVFFYGAMVFGFISLVAGLYHLVK